MEITGIRSPKRPNGRVTLEFEGYDPVEVTAEVVTRIGLACGDSISPDRLARLVSEDSEVRAREAALRLLDLRPRSQAGLKQALAKKGFAPEIIAGCIARLDEAGLLDDQGYALQFVGERIRSRPRGVTGLKAELKARGIAPEMASAAVTDALSASETSELDLAAVAARKFRAKAGEAPIAARRRLQGFLARRGFSAGTIRTYTSRWAADGPE